MESPSSQTEAPRLVQWLSSPTAAYVAGGYIALRVYLGSPRAGAGQAAMLALSSRLQRMRGPQTGRSQELALLNGKLAIGHWGSRYMAVTGPNGVGKTCLLETALHGRPGVVQVPVLTGESQTKIVKDVMRYVTCIEVPPVDLKGSFQRVLWWHRLYTGGQSPVAVLNLYRVERDIEFANTFHAAEHLATEYGMRVIIAADCNAPHPHVLYSGRNCDHMEVQFMSDQTIESIPEFAQARQDLKDAGLYATALELFGGSPLKWHRFSNRKSRPDISGQPAKIPNYLFSGFCNSFNSRLHTTRPHPDKHAIADLFFKDNEVLPYRRLLESGLRIQENDLFFRIVTRNGQELVEPANRALYYFFKYGRHKDDPTIEDLKQFAELERSNRNTKK